MKKSFRLLMKKVHANLEKPRSSFETSRTTKAQSVIGYDDNIEGICTFHCKNTREIEFFSNFKIIEKDDERF